VRWLGLVPTLFGVALIAGFCVALPPVVQRGDYAVVNGIGFIAGPIGAVFILAGLFMTFSRGGPPAD
jgi:hypothetical protein